MADRTPYRPPELRENLRPQAAPVETYVAPAQVVPNESLMGLARGLSSLDAGLGDFLKKRQEEQAQADRLQAETDFHRNNQQGFAEGVASGAIPAYQSKAYVEGYKQAEGRIAGYQLEEKFRSAYDKWPEKGSQDPAAFDKFFQGFLRENIGTNDPKVLQGLVPRLRSLTENAYARNSADRSKALVEGRIKTVGTEANIALEEVYRQGFTRPEGFDYQGGFKRIEEEVRARALAEGANPEAVDKAIIDAVTAKAIEKRRPEYLDFMKRKVPGKDYTYGSTPYGQEQLQKTIDTLEVHGRRAIAEESARRKEARAAELEDVTRRTVEAIVSNPDAPFPEELLKRGSALDGDFRIKANNWRDNIRKAQGSVSPEALRDLNYEIIRSGGRNVMGIIQRGLENGVLNNKEDLVSAYKLGEEIKKNGSKLEGIMSSASAKTIRGAINRRTQSDLDPANVFAPEGISDTGLAATYDFDRLIAEWVARNPEASAQEQERAIGEIGAAILKRLDVGQFKATVYNRPEDAGFRNPYIKQPEVQGPPMPQESPTVAPQAPQAPAAPTPSPQPQAPAQQAPPAQQGAVDPAATQWYLDLTPEQRAQAEAAARQNNLPLGEVISRAWQRQQQRQSGQPVPVVPQSAPVQQAPQGGMTAPDGTPISPIGLVEQAQQAIGQVLNGDMQLDEAGVQRIAEGLVGILRGGNAPGAQAQPASRNFTTSQLRDDPQAGRILDFISGPESTGNYNAVYGRADSQHDLSQYTVEQVLAGEHFKALGGRVRGQSATGRYQIINETLRGLVDEMGLRGDERFTPQLQDRMALTLMKRRGYDEFRAGRITAEEFATNLSKEWAGLPDPRTGRSFYAGDGLNASGVSSRSFLDVLRAKPESITEVSGGTIGNVSFDGKSVTINGKKFARSVSPVDVARGMLGINEDDHRDVLADFFEKTGGPRINPAKVAWCAAYVDSVLGLTGNKRANTLRAADFLKYGDETKAPTSGDIVVFKPLARGSSGHVGFVVGVEGDKVRYIAGNDGGEVAEATLPMSKVAGFRKPVRINQGTQL